MEITGLPSNVTRGLCEHFRVDSDHSNAFTAWKEVGSPQSPAASEYDRLQQAGQLQQPTSPAWIEVQRGTVQLRLTLPRQGLSLLRLAW
jgi:xylan 1,4-beta-xylosidase